MKAKKFLSIILSAVMVLSCMSITAFATGDEITVKSTMYDWSTDGTYLVNQSMTINGTVDVSANVVLQFATGAQLTINGSNGEQPYADGDNGITISSGSLTVTGLGALIVNGGVGNATNIGGSNGEGIFVSSDCSLIIDGANVFASAGADTVNSNGCGVYSLGNVIINSGCLSAYAPTEEEEETNSIGLVTSSDGSFVINGGTFDAQGYYGVKGPMTINGGEVCLDGWDYCYHAQGSDLTISGGKIEFYLPFSDVSTDNATITGGLFSDDVSSYLGSNALCIANTDNSTNGTYPYKVVSGTYLDLETSATYPQSTTVDQFYTLTQTGDTTYTDVTKVRVSWVLPEISASYTLNKTWNPDTLSWVDAKTTATISEKIATFTFTNLSSVAVGATVSFKKSIVANSESETVSDVLTLKSIVNQETHAQQYPEAPSGTITHKYTPTASEFNSLANGSGTYGVYTVSLVSAVKVTFDMQGHGDAVDAQYVGIGGKVSEPTESSVFGFEFGGWYTNADCTAGNEWNFTTDTVSANKTLYAKWTETL